MVKNKQKVLVLDVDGVILKSDILYCDIAQTVFEHNVPLSDMRSVVTLGGEPLFKLVTNGNSSNDNINSFRTKQIELFDSERHLFDDVKTTLVTLSKDFHLAVLSNKPELIIHEILRKSDLHKYFSCVIGLDSGFEKKPSQDGLIHIMSKFRNSEIYFIGDAHTDWLTCANLDVEFIYASYGFDIEPNKYPNTINGFAELMYYFD